MTCESAQALLGPYLDQELGPNNAIEVQQHISDCPNCSAAYDQLVFLKRAIKENAEYFQAPPELAGRIRRSIAGTQSKQPANFSRYWRLIAIAACLLLAISFGFNLFVLRTRQRAPDLIAQQIVSSHIRALLDGRMVEVPSSDQHTVKPWFNGKVDFSPVVKDLKAAGFPLMGGRLDYVDRRTVASLVYQRRQHLLDLFIWPNSEPSSNPHLETTLNGYNVIRWDKAGMTYYLVSDLNVVELQQFVRLFIE